jgi:hypothetical protein
MLNIQENSSYKRSIVGPKKVNVGTLSMWNVNKDHDDVWLN